MHRWGIRICLAKVFSVWNCLQLQLMLQSGAFTIIVLPLRQSAITHGGVAGFTLAPITDFKGKVFLSQLNLTEVSKVNNKMGHAVLKASGTRKESCNHKSSERNQVECVFHPHRKQLSLLNPSATFHSNTKWFLEVVGQESCRSLRGLALIGTG